MVINQENLIKSGYSQFESCLNKDNEMYLKSYQKKIVDEKGIKYFITIDFYDLSTVNKTLGIQFQTHVQFNSKSGFTFDVSGLNDKKITIAELEAFYEKVWSNMDCEYYEYS